MWTYVPTVRYERNLITEELITFSLSFSVDTQFKLRTWILSSQLQLCWEKFIVSLITAGLRSCVKVMFSVVSFCHSVYRGWGSLSMTRALPPLNRVLALLLPCTGLQSPRPVQACSSWTSLYRDPPPPQLRHVQICSTWTLLFRDPPPTPCTGSWLQPTLEDLTPSPLTIQGPPRHVQTCSLWSRDCR